MAYAQKYYQVGQWKKMNDKIAKNHLTFIECRSKRGNPFESLATTAHKAIKTTL